MKENKLFLTSLKQICNEYLIKFSENQSAPKFENRKTSPCSPCAPNLLHVLMSRTTGYHNLCSPGLVHISCISWAYLGHILGISWAYIGHILGISWAYLGYILGISRAYLRHILGISLAYLRHISCLSVIVTVIV